MNRPGLERIKRRTHIRLSLEHLEHRRLMAGLNVFVFTDQDGSRSLSSAMDMPAASRLVYVDLNRDLAFNDGEPLAVSGPDGVARFADLPSGDYLIGLAGGNSAQVLTTSVVPDRSARTVSAAPGAPLTTIISSSDLKHAWSATAGGVLTPIGADDVDRPILNLNGRLLGVAAGSSSNDSSAWALVEQGKTQPALYQLDYQTGSARLVNVQGVPTAQRISGIVRSGNAVYVQLTNGDANTVAALQITPRGVVVGQPVAVPTGTLIGSSVPDRFAVIGYRSDLAGEDITTGSRVSLIELRGPRASIQSVDVDQSVINLSFSTDGQYLFAARQTGGLDVYSTDGALRPAAQLAEATGPVTAGGDGRFVTANASKANELIVWDSMTWAPTGRVQLPAGQGPVVNLAVDAFGDRLLVATGAAALTARLANPAPQSIVVGDGTDTTLVTMGVRLVDRPVPLPTRIDVSQTTDEDVPLSFDLLADRAVRGLGSGLIFAPVAGTALGSLIVTPNGHVTYNSQANVSGMDSATLRVFDGINTTTMVLSLNVRPVNDPPASFTVAPLPIDELAPGGEVAGVATILDVDSNSQYDITTNDSRFYVVDGQVLLIDGASLDYETEPSIDLEVTATDLDNPAFVITRRVTISVRDSNDAPTSIELRGSQVAENEERAIVGQVIVKDPDSSGDYEYSVSDDRFEIEAGQLRLRSGVALDYESEPMIALTIAATDWSITGFNRSVSTRAFIQVLDGNDAPTSLSVSTTDLPSDNVGAVVGRVSVIDPDAADEHQFWVSDARFQIDGNVLRLRDGQSISRDQEAIVSMLVTVVDRAGAVLSESVTLNVVNDAPYQNPRDPFDVDNDGSVFPRDALILVNQLNQGGSRVLDPVTASGESDSGSIYFLDVNGDGLLTPLDALLLINHINRGSAPAINNGSGSGSSGSGSSMQTRDDDALDEAGQLAEGEGPSIDEGLFDDSLLDDSASACGPWLASSGAEEQAHRDAIDAELERLVEELSRARLG